MVDFTRRHLLRGALAGTLGVSLAGCGRGENGTVTDTTTRTTSGGPVTARQVVSGLTSPIDLVQPPGEDRLIVADQVGTAYAVENGALTPFLDVQDRIVDVSGYSERGLLGIAFHPNYATNGRFFVRYSAPRREGTPSDYSHTFVLAEFHAEPGGQADPDSERSILEVPEPQSNHNGGAIRFGPDGHLYVSVGDGGGANDTGAGHVSDWYERNAGGNGQDVTENLLGSVLRIDVDSEQNGKPYAVPADNPLVGREGLAEHFAWGFRNPWRMSFGPNGRLFVADAGQNRFEEVSIVEQGGNYGWNVREGLHCFSPETPSSPPAECPAETPNGDPLRDPIVEYPHSGDGPGGIAVVGGHLYARDDVAAFQDGFVFADWQANRRLFVARPGAGQRWPISAVPIRASSGEFGTYVLAIGRDTMGRLYALTTNRGGVGGETGAIWRLGE